MATLTEDLIERLQPYTKSTPVRMEAMSRALMTVEIDQIPGDVVECGVWRGGNIMMARIMAPDRHCWLYDTFDGMTEPDHEIDEKRPHDDGRPGEKAIERYRAKQQGGTKWDAVSIDEVRRSFAEMGLHHFTHWIKGDVVETLVTQPQPQFISILRLDLDWYWPTRISLEFLYPRIVEGGFLIIDDYGHWMGCKKAVDDFFDGQMTVMERIDYSCVMMRKC